MLSQAQVPNPKRLNGSFTSTNGIENEHIVNLAQVALNGTVSKAQFIYKFIVSDTCRVVFSSSSDNEWKDEVAGKRGRAGYVHTYLDLLAGVEYNLDISAHDLKIYRAGASVSLSYTGYVEYE